MSCREIGIPVQGSSMTYALLTIAMVSLSVCLVGTVRFARARSDDKKPLGRQA